MSDCLDEVETKELNNIVKEETLCHDKDDESSDDYYSQSTLQDKFPFKDHARDLKVTDIQISIKRDTRTTNHLTTYQTPRLPSKETVCSKSVSFIDCENNDKSLKKIQARHEKKNYVDDGITDRAFTEINKPSEDEEDYAIQLIYHEDYKTNEQPFEDLSFKNVVVEDLPTLIKDVEGLVLNNDKQVKKTFEETVNQFKIALQSPIRVESKDIPTLISKDKTDKSKSIDVDDNYYNNAQDNYKDQSDKEIKSKVSSVVVSNAEDEVVVCSVDDKVKINKNTNYEKDLPSHEKMGVVESENVAVLTKAPSESSDEESTNTLKRFTFTDSDLPDSDEIEEILASYPKPTFIEPYSELEEIEDTSLEETLRLLRHRRNKTTLLSAVDFTQMIGIEKLPERFITRLRKPVECLGISEEVSKKNTQVLQSRYVIDQEDQIDEEIILENIKRLKSQYGTKKSISRKKNNNKSTEHKETIKVNIEKPTRKNAKLNSTSFSQKSARLEKINTKEDTANAGDDVEARLGSTSTAQTTTRRNRSMDNDNDCKNTVNKRKFQETKIKTEKKKKRSTPPEIEVRRSKRQLTTVKKNDKTITPPKSILKKSIHEQSTVYNISSSSSESKNLKRSLVEDVPIPKRTRAHKTNSNNNIKNAPLNATPAFPSAEGKQNKRGPYVSLVRCELIQKQLKTQDRKRNSLNMKAGSQTPRPRRPRRKMSKKLV